MSESAPKKKLPWWGIVLILLGIAVIGGLLARVAPVLAWIVALGVLGLAVYVLVKGGAPQLGMRGRSSGLVAAGVAVLLTIGAGAANGASGPAQPAATPQALVAAAPSTAPTPTPKPTTFEEVDVSTPIPFERTTVDDAERDLGTSAVTTPGVAGTKVTTFRVTKVDGKETERVAVRETVTVAPVTEVTARGTREQAAAAPVPFVAPEAAPASECDPNYDGCVPIASDVDCAGGSGDGPAYVKGPVRVIGRDIYKLDRDGDGIGCN